MVHLKKLSVIFLLFGLNTGFISAQNLVMNPSFEITSTNCGSLGGEGYRQDLQGTWDNANSNVPGDSCSSPDLFSACNVIPIIGGPSPTHMPDGGAQGIGYQWSRTGTRHAGFITHSAPFGIVDNYREYIQGRLSTPLTAGQTYCVSMYVSLGEAMPYATNNIGVYFGSTQYMRDACAAGSGIFNLTPQLNYSCAPITDTTSNWVRLQWNYVASGGEQWMLIGNFFNSAATTVANTGHGATITPGVYMHPFAYYFIDDVSVVPNACCYADLVPVPAKCITDAPVNLAAVPPLGGNCTPTTLSGTWSGPGTSASGTFNPATAGPGVHTITYTLSCGYTTTMQISVSPCAMQVCVEANGSLTASGGVAPYSWSYLQPAGTIQITTQAQCTSCGYSWTFGQCLNGFMPATSCTTAATWVQYATGTTAAAPPSYPIKVTDGGGGTLNITSAASLPSCSSTPCPTITVAVTAQTAVTCGSTNNGSATVAASGGTAPYQYLWTPGNLTGATQNNLAAGTYTVVALSSAGTNCTGSTTVTITAATTLNLTSTATPTSCGQNNGSASVTVVGGTGTYTYSWSPSGGTAATTPSTLAPGSYTVTVTQGTCTGTSTAVVANGGASLNLTSTSTPTSCGQNNGSASVTVVGGTGTYTYSWSPSGGTAATTPSTLAPGSYTVTVAQGGCTGTSTVVVANGGSSLNLTTSSTPASCGQSNGSASVTVVGGSGTYTYSWSPSGGTAATTPSTLAAGSYTVTVSQGGCTGTATVSVTGGASSITATATTVGANCGATNGSATIAASGGTAPYTYAWSPSGGTAASATGLASGAYSVLITDASGCTFTQPVNVPAIGGPALSMSSTNATCGQSNGSATVAATGGTAPYTYSWSPSGGTAASATGLSAGTYTVTVTDASGCAVSETAVISGGTAMVISASVTDENCGESNGALSANVTGGSGTYTYLWSPGGSANASITGLDHGIYTLTVTDGAGCTSTQNFEVKVIGSLPVTVNPVTATIEEGDSVQLTASAYGAFTYVWSPDTMLTCSTCDTLYASPNSTTTYQVIVTDTNGCAGLAEVIIYVNPICSKEIFVPSIFSPNGDGNNDQQCVMGSCIVELNFSIYNRWGEKVFETTDQNSCWDGRYKGKEVNSGVFVYKLKARLLNGKEINTSGNITVVQ